MVGRFCSYVMEGCPDGYLQISEAARTSVGGAWCGSMDDGPVVFYSETRTLILTLLLLRWVACLIAFAKKKVHFHINRNFFSFALADDGNKNHIIHLKDFCKVKIHCIWNCVYGVCIRIICNFFLQQIPWSSNEKKKKLSQNVDALEAD